MYIKCGVYIENDRRSFYVYVFSERLLKRLWHAVLSATEINYVCCVTDGQFIVTIYLYASKLNSMMLRAPCQQIICTNITLYPIRSHQTPPFYNIIPCCNLFICASILPNVILWTFLERHY